MYVRFELSLKAKDNNGQQYRGDVRIMSKHDIGTLLKDGKLDHEAVPSYFEWIMESIEDIDGIRANCWSPINSPTLQNNKCTTAMIRKHPAVFQHLYGVKAPGNEDDMF